ncbi:MYB DNA-binding domain protein [Talaromyces stipitatus ATCC 10500]|uniref:MYB DNA-binding domain protein n=1 Tax=Talaromyces stipitatus (strain ATCC 10500 / CBS 375.48 / QM 6759 / NRRL 1006) TaxID=441959 RepID=B8MMQ4_TALSN|nr:MYB DNA-binding domain protein [Talaromyces stipitatus ATCC 10500]EED13810.1 MYB DNA-binding domain protein [Talaromyces stipitatus ATCC 10500]
MRKTGDNNNNNNLSSSPSDDASLPQIRDVHSQLPGLRIAPLRQPVSRRLWNTPFPLNPEIAAHSGKRTVTNGGSTTTPHVGANLPERLPTLEEFVNAARTSDASLSDNHLNPNAPPPPKTILPDFINLQTVEKLPYLFEETISSKRRRIDGHSDYFSSEHLQLPVPQAQNEKKPPPFGPFAILNGLNEPPPNAALFPPIEPGSLPSILTRPTIDSELVFSEKHAEKQGDKRELRLEEILDPNSLDRSNIDHLEEPKLDQLPANDENRTTSQNPADGNGNPSEKPIDANEPMSPKTRGRSRKNLRRWTEQETTDLLRGVVKCGIGNWTAILQQPELKFNKRSAANLKDRFRVCCPWAYGAADPNEATKEIQDTLASALMNAESLTSGVGGKILLPDPRPKDSATISTELVETSSKLGEQLSASSASRSNQLSPTPATVSGSGSQESLVPAKSAPTQSTKSKSTLSSLGIAEPYFTIKSKRRSRRPFTPAEDEALLKGYAVHGFQWTLIQQDKHLNLSHRRATDLRDRFRTKFPNAYREGGSVSGGSIGSLQQREYSNEITPTLDNNAKDKTATRSSKRLKEPPQSLSLPPPLMSPPVTSDANSPDKKRNPHLPDSANLTSISSLLPPLPQLTQSSMILDSSSGGGQGMMSSLSFPSSSGMGNHSASFTSVSSASNAVISSWEDNTLPPFNWNDDIN